MGRYTKRTAPLTQLFARLLSPLTHSLTLHCSPRTFPHSRAHRNKAYVYDALIKNCFYPSLRPWWNVFTLAIWSPTQKKRRAFFKNFNLQPVTIFKQHLDLNIKSHLNQLDVKGQGQSQMHGFSENSGDQGEHIK